MNDRANDESAKPMTQADANEHPKKTGEPRWVTDISIVTASRSSDDQPNPKPASLVELRQLEPLPNTEIGAGGFGVVSRTQDEFGRLVAIKQLRDELNQDETARLRFRVEAEIAAELHEHRGVIPVLRRNIEGQRLWYSMPYVRDGNLASAIAAMRTGTNGEADRRSLLRRFVDVCQTIDYAHSRGVIHGDISPRNVLLGRFGTTYVVGERTLYRLIIGKVISLRLSCRSRSEP